MSKKIIIGFGSKAQVGKDYIAAKLADYFDVERVSFADAVKADLAILFRHNNLDLSILCEIPELKQKIRPLMVEYSQLFRSFKEDHWVDKALNRNFDHQVTVITDVRFPNEVAKIKKLGGYYVDIISDVPPANEVEALYSPKMAELADYRVVNNFDDNYVSDVVKLVNSLLK